MRTQFFLLLIISFACCKNGSQQSNNTNHQQDRDEPLLYEMIQNDMMGNPIIKYTYSYNEKGKITAENIWDSSAAGIGHKEKLYFYKDDTLMTEMQFHDEFGLIYKVVNSYDANGKLLMEESIDTTVYRRKSYTYDDRDNITREETFERGYGTSYVDYTYTSADMLETAVMYGFDGEKVKSNTYKYENDTLSELFFYSAADELEHHWIYEYNDQGQMIAEKELGADGNIYIIRSMIYDKAGNKLVEEGSKYRFFRVDYIYDEANRLKAEHHKNQVGNIQRILRYR